MSDACDILVYGTMGDISCTVESSLNAAGYSTVRVDFPQNVHRDEFGYRRGLMKAVAAFSPRMIMPVGNLLAISRIKKEYGPEIIIPVDDEEKIKRLDSKTGCSAIAAEIGILQPRMYSHPDEIEDFNVIFKRERSFGGSGVYRPKTREALDNLINHEAGCKYLIEDYIEGDDYSVDAVRWNGYFRAGAYRSLSRKGGQGPSRTRQSVEFPELCSISEAMLEHIGYNGVCGFDFRVDSEGKAYFLECNPRYTGGVGIQVKSGFDIPAIYAGLAFGREISYLEHHFVSVIENN